MPLLERALSPVAGGVKLSVRLTPKSSRDAIQGLAEDAEGGVVLRCTVTAVPENGKANAALVKMLAKAWKLPRTSIEVVGGLTDRRKTLLIHGEPVDVAAALRDKLAP
ncbi:DUF167 domain-containing protein [Insolitispirillum peregrinum]|uniref:UPF0235 protein SAMN05421779_108108 n=1 Tax=Insolitispirillum peregrinum TaxID=80876 RepID=A0A1N7PWD7_9PROT|nr:DUF167 family protein [Insolitispirillum peregrinum]SIT14906.1 hypothetical protein SAMN05421779_108108 [Insolitispirillum peregrinum]